MVKFLQLIKSNIVTITVVVGLIVIVGSFFTLQNHYTKKYLRLQGKYEALADKYAQNMRLAIATVDAKEKEIAAQNERIAELGNNISGIEESIRNKSSRLTELERELAALDPTQKDSIIVNLTAQVNEWKDKFSLAQNIIADKDGIIFSLNTKYEAQVVIANQWKARHDELSGITGVLLDSLKVADKRLAMQGLTIKAGGGVTAVLAGVIVYSLIKR